MSFSNRTRVRAAVVAGLAAAAIAGTRGDATPQPNEGGRTGSAAGPEVFATGFESASGIAVDAHGAVLVTDRRAGTLTRVGVNGVRRVVLDNLQRPGGVAADPSGGAFVIEDGGHVLRLDADGTVSGVTTPVRRARALATGPDGRLYISIRREQKHGFEIVRLEPSGTLTSLASGFGSIRGLVVNEAAVYVAMAPVGRQGATLARMLVKADGRLGPLEPLRQHMPRRAYAVAVDAAGDLFVSGADAGSSPRSGVILKRRASGQVDTLAVGLRDPKGLAFAPTGDLLAIEGGTRPRVLRFRAPLPPQITAPPFTNQTPLRVSGRAMPGALVQAFDTSNGTPALASSVAQPLTGTFALDAPLAENSETLLSFVATGAGGAGLVGRAATASIVHESHLPTVAITQPLPGVHVRGAFVLRARADDEGSGVLSMSIMQDESVVATFRSSAGQPLTGTTVIDTASWTEGPHALTAAAMDRAGNSATVAQLLVVDRTPPDTQIVSGPMEETAETTAVFTFAGADVQSANLTFAWRLDDGIWSTTTSLITELTSLAAGRHRFEVKALDSAGNEDPTPASLTFTVTTLRIRLLEPVPGAAISTETVWVRGVVDGGGREVTVTIPLPPEFQDELSMEVLTAATEAGTFAAQMPVTPSMATVTVIARNDQGAAATGQVDIAVQSPLSPPIRFEASPAAGLAPHAVRFSPEAFPPGSSYSLDLESDGTIDYEGATLSDRDFLYTQAGIHVAMLRVMTPDGQMRVARTSVHVYNPTTLEARLQAVWGSFRDALRAGDIARVVSFVHSGRRPAWEAYFRRFTPDLFAATDTVLAGVTLLEVAPGRAECEMMREVDGLLYSFPVSFVMDADGGWRLWQL